MMTENAINQQFIACNAAIKSILEVLIGKEIVPPHQIAGLLRDQAAECSQKGGELSAALLSGFADFAEDPSRIAGRRLLNEPPHGNA